MHSPFYILHSLFSEYRRLLSNGIRVEKIRRGRISLSVQDFQIWRIICREKMETFVKYPRFFSFLTRNRCNSILHICLLKFWCNTTSNIQNRCILPIKFVSCDSQNKKPKIPPPQKINILVITKETDCNVRWEI